MNTNIPGGVTWTPHQGSSNPARAERVRDLSPSASDRPNSTILTIETTCQPATATNSSQGRAMLLVEVVAAHLDSVPHGHRARFANSSGRATVETVSSARTATTPQTPIGGRSCASSTGMGTARRDWRACIYMESTPARHFTRWWQQSSKLSIFKF